MTDTTQRRLFIIGLDAMDVPLARRWAEGGFLPTFRRLFETSAWADYRDSAEHTSGTIWSSLSTGMPPSTHDFYFSTRFLSGSYRTRLGNVRDLKSEPFWKWFADAGRKIVIADVPFSTPDAAYGGKQFWGWGQHDWVGKKCSVPESLLPDLRSRFGEHPVPLCHNYDAETESLTNFKSGLLEAIRRRTSLLKSLVTDPDWDLFHAAFSECHCAGHLMWHLEDETHHRHSAEQLAAVGHGLREVYAEIDRGLGELIDCLDSRTSVALIFSHGFGPEFDGKHLFPEILDRFNRIWLGQDPKPPEERTDSPLLNTIWQGSVQRLPAAWRAAVKERLPIQLRGWIGLKRQQNSKRWARALAFRLPNDDACALRINLVGREPDGKLQPGDEYGRYLDAFTRELRGLINVDTGEPAIDGLFRLDQRLDPMEFGSGADLMICWKRDAAIRAVRSDRLGVISGERNTIRTGEHIMRAMLLVHDPRSKNGHHAIDGMNVLDFAPTICDLAGIEPGAELEGTSRCPNLLAND